MNKYYETLTNLRGDVLFGYRAQIVDDTGAVVDIYQDRSGTRFTDGAGNIVNYATSDDDTGMVQFYWTAATGQLLQVLDPSGDLVRPPIEGIGDNYVLNNLPGDIPQSAVTDLTADLAAKADTVTVDAALATKANTADLASTDSAKGAAMVAVKNRATGAIGRTQDAKNDEFVSLFDFGVSKLQQDAIFDGTSTLDLAAIVETAVDSGENLYFPGKSAAKYLIDGQIQVSSEKQKLVGFGSRLDFRGTDSSKNAIELLSTRRDTGSSAPNRTWQQFGGFRILGDASAAYASLIFLEEGTTFPYVHDILSEAGTGKGYFGTIADAFVRINGNATSYVNSPILDRILLHGIKNGSNFPQCGFWVEGAIEGVLRDCEAFYFNEGFRLGDSTGTSRNVQNMLFDHCHSEPTKPGDAVNGQYGVNFYYATETTFADCKFKPGNASGTNNSRGVLFSAGSDGARNIRFRDCDFQGFGHVDYAFECASGASAHGIKVMGGTLNDFILGRALNSGGKLQIDFDERVTYHNMVPKRERMQARSHTFAGLTVGSGATDNATTTANLTGIFQPEGNPALAAPSVSSNFCFLEPYRVAAEGTWKVKAYQQTGSSRAIASGNINFRPFRPEEILAQSSFTVNYASLASGGASLSSYTVPGARLGLPVVATFYDGSANGQNGVILEAYPTTDNTVTVLRFNAHNAAVDLGEGTLVISVIRPVFDLTAEISFDIATVGAGSRGTTSVSVPGVALGDQCIAWYSGSQESCVIRPRLSTAGTVNFEIINPSGSTPTGGAHKIYVGVYNQPGVV